MICLLICCPLLICLYFKRKHYVLGWCAGNVLDLHSRGMVLESTLRQATRGFRLSRQANYVVVPSNRSARILTNSLLTIHDHYLFSFDAM
jgi:hypothetical protein